MNLVSMTAKKTRVKDMVDIRQIDFNILETILGDNMDYPIWNCDWWDEAKDKATIEPSLDDWEESKKVIDILSDNYVVDGCSLVDGKLVDTREYVRATLNHHFKTMKAIKEGE